MTFNTSNYTEQGGARTVVGGSLDVVSGGVLDIESGGALKIAGVDVTTALGDAAQSPVTGLADGYKIARGVHTTVAASDTVVTGLATVVAIVVSLEEDPDTSIYLATAAIGDQAGAPAAGSVIIKTWKVTTGGAAGNPTPIATTSFSKQVNWVAVGT